MYDLVKFMFSKKATKIEKIFTDDLTPTYTANVNRQTTDKLLFSYANITGENV